MSEITDFSHVFRVADLPTRKPTRFHLQPDQAELAGIAKALSISAVLELSFKGEIRPSGKKDWLLEADLQARVEQPCIVTLAPVASKIIEPVIRRYVADMDIPEADEIEMPEDDTVDPLPDAIDIGAVLTESLALALPLYPKAEGAELGQAVFTEPGSEALTDESMRPFADLANILKKGTPKQ
jgi:uncharacterized metal-binding protein YceD (DUF177 family)